MRPIFKEKSCGVVVYCEEEGTRKYLLLHYPDGHWDLAKGHVEEDETEIETAHRELEEETGITEVTLDPDFREPINYSFERPKGTIQKEVVFFVGKTSPQSIQISHEHQDSCWLPYEEALKKITFDNARNLVKKAEAHLGS